MTRLQGQQLAALRRQTTRFLKDTCTIERPLMAQDAYGHAVTSFTAVASGVACRMITEGRTRDRDGTVAGAEMQTMRYRLIVAWNTDIRDGDRVQYNSETYEITQLDDARSDKTDRQAIVARLG
jgi:head-tail adaptor